MEKDITNTSGQGSKAPVLDIVAKRFNWGAFFFSWVWGIGNQVWLTLLIIPFSILLMISAIALTFIGMSAHQVFLFNICCNFVSLAIAIWFGVQGNRWAWQSRRWKSVAHFHDVQRIWAIVGTILIGVGLTGVIAAMTLPVLLMNTKDVQLRTSIKIEISVISQVVNMKEALDEKCSLTSEGLATCFENSLKIKSKYSNRIEVADGSVYQFYGDGFCKNSGDCYIAVDVNGDVRPNLDDVDRIVVPLYVNENGYLRVDSEALTKYIQSQ